MHPRLHMQKVLTIWAPSSAVNSRNEEQYVYILPWTLLLYLKTMNASADKMCSVENGFAGSWSFVYWFGRLPSNAKLVDGCNPLEKEFLEMIQQKLKNH